MATFEPTIKALLLVGIGGGIGSISRYLLGGWILHASDAGRFPLGTFAVNVAGCLIAGALAGLAERHGLWGPDTRLLPFTGLLGGFTTFSAFGLETVTLMRRGEVTMAAMYAGGTVMLGIAAIWVGIRLAAFVPR